MPGIRERVIAVRSRQQRQWLWRCLSWGLLAGGAAAALYGLAAIAFPQALEVSFAWIAAALVAGPVLGALFAAFRPRAMRDAAVAIDRTCRLKDRVATALHLMVKNGDSPVRDLQLADAEKHLARVDPKVVAPIQAPRSWYWGLGLACAAIALGFWAAPEVKTEAAVVSNDVVVAQANRVEEHLEELKKFNEENADPEVEKLLKELAAKIEELKQPGLAPKEALAKLSEMETALQEKQSQLADPDTAATLQMVGEALSLAEPFQSAGQAMSQGEMEKAAEELANLELPDLDRQTEKAVTEKLQKAGQNAKDGMQKRGKKQLQEALDNLSQGMTKGSRAKFKEGAEGLAGECKSAGRRKKLSDLLRKQSQCLGECKSECEGECQTPGDGKKKGGTNWGTGKSGNEPGEKTAKFKTGPQINVKGQDSGQGDSEVETLSAPEQQQEAVREYREKAKEYEQLSESVLDSEPIPLGHRQTIRRYFEMIRPQEGETDAVNEKLEKPAAE